MDAATSRARPRDGEAFDVELNPATRHRADEMTSGACAPSTSAPITNPFTGMAYTNKYFDILRTRQKLPVYAKRDEIQAMVRQHPVVLLVGETGSGKTTQVPHFIAELRDQFPGLVACTQPRRIAAISVATRVAEEMDVVLGNEVGYHVRFQSVMSKSTRVLYSTDGMLLREMMSDPDLCKYSVVVVDEAHERTVDTDIVLGLLKQLLQRRPMLRLVVMSATLDVATLQRFFPAAPLIQVSGRMFPVEVVFSPTPVQDYVAAAVECVLQLHAREGDGDVLCFLTGEAEIERAVKAVKAALHDSLHEDGSSNNNNNNNRSRSSNHSSPTTDAPMPSDQQHQHDASPPSSPSSSCTSSSRPTRVSVLPLYGSLSLTDQQRVFAPAPPTVRKIIFSTNIAETSVTVDGIVFVVDGGFSKQSLYASDARVDYLLPSLISKASAEQRRGRAGRTRPGTCYRLYTRQDFDAFPNQAHPEILRCNIVNALLHLLNMGITNPCSFPFLDAPTQQGLSDAYYQLMYFGAVDEELQLTPLGKRMAHFPVDVCIARMLIKAADHGCAGDAVVVAAMLEAGTIFTRPAKRGVEADAAKSLYARADGDHLTLFFAFHAYYKSSQSTQYCWDHFLRPQAMQQAVQVYGQLRRIMQELHIPIISTYRADSQTVNSVALRKAILEGFFTQVARLMPNSEMYRTVRDGLTVRLHHRSSILTAGVGRRPTWLMYDRLEVHGPDGTFIRTGSAVEIEWLLQVSDFFRSASEVVDADIAYELKQAKERLQL